MALFGPTGYAFEIDSYTASTNTVGAAVTLPGITEFSGIKSESVVSAGIALGDEIESEIPTGVRRFEDITLQGFLDDASTGAFRRLGRPATQQHKRTFKVTHKSGVTQSLEVFVKKNDPITSTSEVTMFECVLGVAAQVTADATEAGF